MCEKCDKKDVTLIAIALVSGQHPLTLLCLKCAVESGHFCPIHGEHLAKGQLCPKCLAKGSQGHCEICGDLIEGDRVILMQPCVFNGALNTISCVPCAEESVYYCKTHQRPHLVADSGEHFCLECRSRKEV